ncbi:MAG TPA: 5'-nucleotidase C-terminal domain-containing protein [Polyangia bacterium]|nr:5'-nucleotidase C-terminal domain-containing protein [Polyangia bacterium]
MTAARSRAAAGDRQVITLLGGNEAAPALFARALLQDGGQEGARTVADLLAGAGYDAVALGHHELSLGVDVLARLIAALNARGVPVVASNLHCEAGTRSLCAFLRTDVMIHRGGTEIGVLATIAPEVLPEIAVAARRGLTIDDPATAIRAGVRRLRARGATRVLVMTQGPRDARALGSIEILARQLGDDPAAGAPDLLLAGGLSDEETVHPLRLLRRDGAPPVVGAPAATAGLTRVALPLGGARLSDDDGDGFTVERLRSGVAPNQPDVEQALRAPIQIYCDRYGRPITPKPVAATMTREAFIQLTLEIMRRRAQAEIAVLNAGAVRAMPFPINGQISEADLQDALPYPAIIGSANVAGPVVESALAPALTNPKAALVGLARGSGGLEVNGRPLDKARMYKVATIAFVTEGGDGLVAAGALKWSPLPGAPDLRVSVAAFLREEAVDAGARTFDVRRGLGAPAHDRLLIVGLSDFDLDLSDTTIRNAASYGDAQLARAQQTSFQGEATGVLQLRLPRHQEDSRLDLKYGWARTQASGTGMPVVSAETADLITFTSVYSYSGLRDRRDRPVDRQTARRVLVPDPYARVWVESEFTRPDVTATQTRDYHHLQAQSTVGAIFTLTPKLQVRGGGGARRELLATGADGRWQSVLEAGATLGPTALTTFGPFALKIEGTVDYTFVDPAVSRDHELRGTGKLAVPLLPLLFVTAGVDVFGAERQRLGWASAYDTTVGLRVHFDAAHQRL